MWVVSRSYTVYMVGVATVPGISRTMVAWTEGPPVPLEGFGLAVWGLRKFMQHAFIALVGIFWVQLAMQFLHYGLRWAKYIGRIGCSLVLWIPVMLGVFIEYSTFLLCLEYTAHDSLLPVIPFLGWTAWVILLSRWANGPAKAAEFASAQKSEPEPTFQEGPPEPEVLEVLPEVVVDAGTDDQSNADTVSCFET